MAKRIKKIDEEIRRLEHKKRALEEKADSMKLAKLKRLFLDAYWTLTSDMKFKTVDPELAKALLPYDDGLVDIPIAEMFSFKKPFSFVDSIYVDWDEDSRKTDGIVEFCVSNDSMHYKNAGGLCMIGMLAVLKKVTPYFKNLFVELPGITMAIAEVEVELQELQKFLRELNKGK